MLDIVADLHLHSHFSRAVSPQMNLFSMSQTAKQKGINLLSTGDFTHPLWIKELESQLIESEGGMFKIKDKNDEIRFLLGVEISTIFTQNNKGRRIHNLIFVPSFAVAERISRELIRRGCNLSSDGRPIIGLSSKELLQLILEIDDRNMLIPAHIWTPWFGLLGQKSGFNSIEEAFEELSPYIYGIETGLSSDPKMNWQIQELENRSILSFSDAHSLSKMGREATVFRIENLSYENIRKAIMQQGNRVLYTIEFYPEEGKYHYSGHRACRVVMSPEEQLKSNGICPVCGRKVTDGVMRRVMELSRPGLRSISQEFQSTENEKPKIAWIKDPNNIHPPFVRLVPLLEIIAKTIGSSVLSKKTQNIYELLCRELGSELNILLKTEIVEINKSLKGIIGINYAHKISDAINKVRLGEIAINPGYDGVYGTINI